MAVTNFPNSEINNPWRIIRLCASDWNQLLGKVEELAKSPDSSFTKPQTSSFENITEGCRLAISAVNSDELKSKASLFLKQHSSSATKTVLEQKGIYWNTDVEFSGKLAFLFPGQGSQYPNMLRDLVTHNTAAQACRLKIDEICRQLNYPTFDNVTLHQSEQLGKNIWLTQHSLLIANSILHAAVRALGLRPQRISGHSYGEFTALHAAESWNFAEAAEATYHRCSAIENVQSDQGAMLSVIGEESILTELANKMAGNIFISNQNARNQTVLAGSRHAVSQLAKQLKENGIQSKLLSVPCAFHSPLMLEVQKPLEAALRSINTRPPATAMLSSVTNRYVAEPDDIRQNLVTQMTRPVNYVALIERLASEGVTTFIEVGPGQVLTKLHRNILTGQNVHCISTDDPKLDSREKWSRVEAQVDVLGLLIPRIRNKSLPNVNSSRSTQASPKRVDVTSSDRCEHSSAPEINISGVKIIELCGSPYEMGYRHGKNEASGIRKILRRYSDLASSKLDQLRDLNQATNMLEKLIPNEDMEELRGIAAGADVSVENIIAHNLYVYPDVDAGCSHFAVTENTNSDAGSLHASNEDLPLGLMARDCLLRHVQVRKPTSGNAYLTFAIAGQVAGINGINSEGVCVSSSMLLDLPRRETTMQGVLHALIVKRILSKASNLDEAIQIMKSIRGTGAWGLCLSDCHSNRIAYLEYDGAEVLVDKTHDPLVAGNHTQLHQAISARPHHSNNRLVRLEQLVSKFLVAGITPHKAQNILRDRFDISRNRQTRFPTMNTICRVDNMVSIVMQPKDGTIWITRGPASQKNVDEFVRLDANKLLHERLTEFQKSKPDDEAKIQSEITTSLKSTLDNSYHSIDESSKNSRFRGSLIESVDKNEAKSQTVAQLRLEPAKDPFLVHHLLKKQPLLPFVISIEAFTEAAIQLHGLERNSIELYDLEVVSPLKCFSTQAIRPRVWIKNASDHLDCRLTCDFHNRAGKLMTKDRIHFKGEVKLSAPSNISIAPSYSLPEQWHSVNYPDGIVIYNGPPFRYLKKIGYDHDIAWGLIIAPPLSELAGDRATDGWATPSAVLDCCLYACGYSHWKSRGSEAVIPQKMGRLSIARLPNSGEECVIQIIYKGEENGFCDFDFTLFGENKEPLLQAANYRGIVFGGTKTP